MNDTDIEVKKDLLKKYARGLEKIWKIMVDEGPETGDPLVHFIPAINKTEESLAKLLE